MSNIEKLDIYIYKYLKIVSINNSLLIRLENFIPYVKKINQKNSPFL